MDCQPRSKNGRPPHSTTGVANASSNQARRVEDTPLSAPAAPNIWAMPASSKGAVRNTLHQKRLVIEINSILGGSAVAEITRGSRAIPQIGQSPGPRWTTCGCIGQVYSTSPSARAGGAAAGAGEDCKMGSDMPEGCGGSRYICGAALNFSAQPVQQKT